METISETAEQVIEQVAEAIEAPAIVATQVEAAIETKTDKAEIVTLSLAEQVAGYKAQLVEANKLAEMYGKDVDTLKAELVNKGKDIETLQGQAQVQATEIVKLTEAVRGYEATIAEQAAKIEQQAKALNLTAYKDVAEGTSPVAQTISDNVSLVEKYNALKGDEQFKFYQEHKAELWRACGK